MFQVGQYVVYGHCGVCTVEHIGVLEEGTGISGKEYYTLCPCYHSGGKIYIPVDSQKVIMRSILSKEEAMQLIHAIPGVETLWIADERKREQIYKETIHKCDCMELVKIIKTIYLRMRAREEAGKKLLESDLKYFHVAEDRLYGELAVSLGMNLEQTKTFVEEQAAKL
ncbi:MAG: CarD family transcriptional regulator [Lachnospiraceae bacterium]